MAEPLFDDIARAQRRSRALARTALPFLAERIVEDLLERLVPVRRTFDRGLVTGCLPALHERLAGAANTVHFADTIDGLADWPEEGLDLLLIVGELDTRDELPLLLRVARSRMAGGGLIAGAFPGGHSLPALRTALHAADSAAGSFAPRTHPRVEVSAFAGLLDAAGFAEPVVDVDRVRLRYRSLARLVADLRDHAATNSLRARPRRGLGRQALTTAEQAFAALGADGATEEQVEIIHYLAWAPRAVKDRT